MRIKAISFFVLLTALFLFSCESKKESTVIIKGEILNYEQDILYMKNYSSENMVFKEEILEIPLIENRKFDFTFSIEKPAYYRIGRTYMYLSPGDSLEMTLDTRSRKTAVFKGQGAQANNYLRNLPYPKGGSYWGLDQVKEEIKTFKDAPVFFQEVVEDRTKELNKLVEASDAFIRLEKARLNFDNVNSLNSVFYLYYMQVRRKEITEQEMELKIEEAKAYYISKIKEALTDFNNPDFLQLEVFQSLIYSLRDSSYRNIHQLPELNSELKEYILTSDLLDGFGRQGCSKEYMKTLNEELREISNKDYSLAIENQKKKYEVIQQGAPAIDITFTNLSGDSVKLSDYKNDIIVVDFWATWCGPCLNERPAFEALEHKFAGKGVTFLSVSIDTRNVWKTFVNKNELKGNQLHIYRSELEAYRIVSIPRFFVIDRNFEIVDVFAPIPSSGDLEKLINNSLTK